MDGHGTDGGPVVRFPGDGAARRLAGLGILSSGLFLGGCETDATGHPNDMAGDPADGHSYRVVEVVDGLEHPWGAAFLPGGDVLVTEKPGRLRWVREGTLQEEPVDGTPQVEAVGQGGLLDVALHPDFESNGLVYLSYSKGVDGGITTAVARGRWEDGALRDTEDILVADATASGGRHFGSRLLFDQEGLLYVTVGDRGLQDPAQDRTNHIGSTVRIHDDGSVPTDNPFLEDPDALDEIFTYGNRNAQGMALHPETGDVWQNEHGPRGGDELNRMEAGGNYGWPEFSFGDHYDGRSIPDPTPDSGTVPPVLHWTPAIAPSGLAFYTGDRFPEWRGDAFNGGLVGRQIRRVVLEEGEAVGEEVLLEDYGSRIRAIVDGPDGYLYFLTDSSNGVLGRLEPEG